MENVKKVLKVIEDVFIFIITLPFNIFKYLNLGFYYIIKLLLRETPEEKKKREEEEAKREKEINKERERAQEYIKQTSSLKIENNKNNYSEHKDKKQLQREEKEEHRLAKERIRREKLRQKEEERKERQNLFQQLKERNFISKRKQKQLDKKRQILSLDVNSEDAKRSEEKLIFKYVAKKNGKFEKGEFQGYSKLDVHSYLISEGYEVYEITTKAKANIFNTDIGLNKQMKKSSLIFYLTQLSTFLKAGIPIVEAMKILTSQAKSNIEKTIWKGIVYELTMGSTLSDAMLRSGNNVFPKLLINMVKTAEMTGDLPQVLDEQVEYYKSTEKTRKEMINAMIYPLFVLIFAIAIVTYIMLSVVPQFVNIYDSIGADLPAITKALINISLFMRNNIILITIIILAILFSLVYLYKRNVVFKASVQRLFMHVPVFGQVIIYNEVNMFTKTFATLINNNIFITDSMDILSRITDNEIYKSIIFDAVDSLARGDVLSAAFKDQWAFPNIAYQMIVTGERTGQLGSMMEKVSEYYQEEHFNAVTRIKALVEPIMIIFLAVIVGGILLAVIIPMFSIYNNIV